eukprot:TRINITY_DN7007_c0_g1_i1.p1 TRINITY_DN7007_c0_g1~~TRINITY_DN7007_c0_g1_i1.p1  ORF type:complete len:703 (+),score=168.43 TRINITY_DN7007_c0_g1_i1:100-2208(+)
MAAMAGIKREANAMPEDSIEDNKLTFTPLGAGQEVGRSCHLLQYKGFNIMLDCGIHPGKKGADCLPYTDEIDAEDVHVLLVTHFHLDHCAALPWWTEKTTFKGRVFMTPATKAIYRWMLKDYVRVSSMSGMDLFTAKDVENSLKKIEVIDFHQTINIDGLGFTAYCAGHVLGACMYEIAIAGVKILYTGDFSREEDRHLMSAELPPTKPDILITESTFGKYEMEPRSERESKFTGEVHRIVQRGGRCLIPMFALGRAQELLLILDEYWQAHPELQGIPIYYASALAKRCMAVFQTFTNMMSNRIQQQMKTRNPFKFKHISNLRDVDHFDNIGDLGPSVVLASPGMLQSGMSRELFERWAVDSLNGVIVAGYHVEGTLARELQSQPKEVRTMSGRNIPRNCSITYVSFMAHVDAAQNKEFIKALSPQHLILVHGQAAQTQELKSALLQEYEDSDDAITVYNPKNTEPVPFFYRGEKMAKVVGAVAKGGPSPGKRISGVLVTRAFNYVIVDPSELEAYTDLKVSSVRQRQSIPFAYDLALAANLLKQIHGAGTVVSIKSIDGQGFMFMDAITVNYDSELKALRLEWVASPEADMWAESVVSAAMQVEASPAAMQLAANQLEANSEALLKDNIALSLTKLLEDFFGTKQIRRSSENALTVVVDEEEAHITLPSLEISTTSSRLRNALASLIKRFRLVTDPYASEA